LFLVLIFRIDTVTQYLTQNYWMKKEF